MGKVERILYCKEHDKVNDGCSGSLDIGFVEHNE
jgi:hypothetical protein